MKQAGYSKRPRGRSFERRQTPKHMNGDAGEIKARNNPQQIIEKYLTLARDAASLGDPVSAENYFQYADHYHRLASASRLTRTLDRQSETTERQPSFAPKEDAEDLPPPPSRK